MSAPVDVDVLRHPARLRRYAPIRLRLRAVILSLEGQRRKRIAAQLDRRPAWVIRRPDRFKAEGVEGLFDRPRSGRPTKLARDREESFRARVPAGPRPEDTVRVRRGKDLQRIWEKEFAATHTPDGVYRLLHRLGLSWVSPRPRHPKSDRAAQERFRDEAPLLSKRSAASTPAKQSRPGSKTRRVWDCEAP